MKPTIPPLLLAATLCASALVIRPAQAQDYMGYGQVYITAGMDMAAQQPMLDQIRRDSQRRIDENRQGTSSRPIRRTPKVRAVTTYRASRAVGQRVQTRLIAFVAKSNSPATVAQVKRDLEGDVVGKWAKVAASDGLGRGDVADAMAENWGQNWQIANGVMSVTPAQMRGLRRQLAGILTSNAAFARLSNAGRQEMAEGFIYSQALQGAAYLDAVKRGDQARQKQISDGTRAGFQKATGLDLRRLELTDTGFAARS